MKLIEFVRHQSPFAAGEQAAFASAVAERYEAAGVGRIIGSVDDKGMILAKALSGDPVGAEGEDGTEPAPLPGRSARGGRQT